MYGGLMGPGSLGSFFMNEIKTIFSNQKL
ncbi:MAG: hypothetical protein JJE55_15560 [Flavobacteriaceae bacterium]|nr:hypothetical protein [Flavobacteriaceae bacterium]